MKRLLTVLGLSMISTLARADYANTWSCDFGDNYAAQVAANFDLAAQATTEQATGTAGSKNGETFLLLSDSASDTVSGGITSTFKLPDEVVFAGGDWQVEFDYAPSYGQNDKDDTKYGLAFYGVDGVDVTLLFKLDGQKNNGGINVLDGSGTTLATIAASSLTSYTKAAAAEAKWLHVTVTGSAANNNVTLAIKYLADNNDVTLSSSIVSSSFVSPYSLTIKTANYSNRHQWAGFDDFICGYDEAAGITTWDSGTVTGPIKFGAALTTDETVNIEGGTSDEPISFTTFGDSEVYGLTQTAAMGWTIKESHALRIINGTYGVNSNIQLGTSSGNAPADRSSGYLTISSGNVTMEGGLAIHGGTATIDGGTVVQNGNMSIGAKVRGKDAFVNINGGSVTASAVKMGQFGQTSTLNLNGGSLTTGSFSINNSGYSGTVNINGGTLIAADDNTAFIPASDINVNVGANGGTLNLDGLAITAKAAIGGTGALSVTGGGTLTLEAVPGAALNIVDSTVVVPYGTAFTAAVATSGTGTIAVDCTGHQIGDTILTSAVSLAGVSVTITGLANVQANLAEGGQEFVIAEKEEEPVVAEVVPMFITGGQSNTDGRLDSNTLPSYLASNERALVSYHAPLAEARLGQFAAYAPCSGEAGQPGKWAYDAELYYHIGNVLGKTFYVAKTSYGGTSIRPSINNSPSGHSNAWLAGYGAGYHWSADEKFLAATVSAGRTFEQDSTTYDGQSLLKSWIENIDAAIDALIADNKTPDIKAIIWHQGESDGNNGQYASDLTAVVTYVREHLAEKLNDDKYLTLPFFCGNIPRKSSLFTVNLDKNFATIEETADNNMHVVDIYDLTMKSDNKHFDAASAVVFGKRLFNRMIDEGVIDATKVAVADCVREPDFGTEQVINNTTTWTWENKSGDIATSLTNIDGIYFHAASGNSRKVQIFDAGEKTLNWTIGDGTATVVSKGAYCTAYENNSSAISATSTAGENNKANYMVAMNAGRSGKFEVFYWAREACTAKLYLNGTEVDSKDAPAGEVVRLNGINTVKSVYYLALGKGAIMGARFVPDEEMPAVTLDIDETGWGTFGNLYEANFALPEGVTAYAINAIDGQPTFLSMTEVGALNLGDAVVVSGKPGTYTLTSAEGAAYDSENLMVVQKETGILEATSGSDFINFVQTSENGELTFTKSDGTQTLAAGKAFFSITEGDAHSEQQTLNCRNTGDTTKFTWTGKGTDTLWTTLENWAWPDGKAPLNAPGAGATVSFDEAAEVTFGANTSSGVKIVVNADVSFASDDGTTERIVIPSSIAGTGRLTLKNKIKLQTVTYGSFSVDCTVEIEDGASATLYTSGRGAKITINGALTGGGSLTAANRNDNGSIVLSGDMSGYTGLLTTTPGDGTITVSGDTGGSGIAIKAADAAAALEKVSGPVRPSGAAKAVTEEAYAAYYKRSAVAKEGADGYFVVTIVLDEEAVAADTTFATVDFNDIINSERDTLTLTNAKPGLYYSIVGGTDVKALNIEGEKALATSTSVSPAKPDFGDDESNVHFFRVRVSSN